jgi:hypothetical protein
VSETREDEMWPHVVQFETRQRRLEGELELARELERARAGREPAPSSKRPGSSRLRALRRQTGGSLRAAVRRA